MSKVVKYERIQTADTDIHAATANGADHTESSPDSPPDTPATRIDMPSSRFKFNAAQTSAATLVMILLYFCLSIGLTFYQRKLLKEFRFPLFVVLTHLVVKFCISLIIRIVYRLVMGRSRVQIGWSVWAMKMAPTGLASGIDIGFSSWGLELVSIALYTMTKSTSIVFILIFAIILGLERANWSTFAIVIAISLGLGLFTYKSTEFNALGFGFLLFASLVSGIRWSLAQIIMQTSSLGLHNPVDMVYFMQPWMILAILPVTVAFEAQDLYEGWSQIGPNDSELVTSMTVWILGGAFIAFFMELSEFMVLSFTSSLTLSVSGIFKEICQLVLAVKINNEVMSPTNIVGLFMCLGGICCHAGYKYSTIMRNEKRAALADALSGNDSVSFDERASHPVRLNWRNGQNAPLLDETLAESDSDDPTTPNKQSSSDIIFDVLKRRDTRSRITCDDRPHIP